MDISPIDNVKKYQYEEFDDEFIPMSNKYIDFVKAIYPNILEATFASGGKFIENKLEKEFLNSLGCNICDMEIAGIMRVCYLSNVGGYLLNALVIHLMLMEEILI